jgi:hypothetical protein
MKRRNTLREGIEQVRRELLRASRQASAGRNGRINIAVRENVVVASTGGPPDSQVHVSSTQYAPISQRGRGTGGQPTNTREEDR